MRINGKKIVKIIRAFLKINCKLSKLDDELLNFAERNNLKMNIFKNLKSFFIKQGYKIGRGSFKIRGEIIVENLKNGKDRLVITSIPYQVNKSNLNERIAELVREKKIEGISDIRDESNREGIRVAIDLRRNI